MSTLNEKKTSDILTAQEIRRYAIQIDIPLLGLKGQEKIKQTHILVAGAGAKGTTVLQILTAIGFGKIGISDNSLVQESDLSRQHLYGNGDLGKQKAIIARQRLMEINHFVEFQLHNVFLTENNIAFVCEPYDILIDVTNNTNAHYLISDAAVKLNKPVLYGAIKGNEAYAALFNYREGPSYRCAYPQPDASETDVNAGSLFCYSTVSSIIGSIIANEAIKIAIGAESKLNGTILKLDAAEYHIGFIPVIRNPENFAFK
jgi:molybdopterin/thiamine biosynthesis adenylyltransferase